MANRINLELYVNAGKSLQTISDLELYLNKGKEALKELTLGSKEFETLSAQIKKTESQVKNLNKTFEGLDTEALVGEYGKMAAGIGAVMNGINAVAQEIGNEDVTKAIQRVQTGMAVVEGIKGATEAWTAAQKLLNVAMFANPIGIIVLAVTALGAAIYGAVKYGDEFKKSLTNLGDRFIFLKPYIEAVKLSITALQEAWYQLKKLVMGQEWVDQQAALKTQEMMKESKKLHDDIQKSKTNAILAEKEKREAAEKEAADKEKIRTEQSKARLKEKEDAYKSYYDNIQSMLDKSIEDEKNSTQELIDWAIEQDRIEQENKAIKEKTDQEAIQTKKDSDLLLLDYNKEMKDLENEINEADFDKKYETESKYLDDKMKIYGVDSKEYKELTLQKQLLDKNYQKTKEELKKKEEETTLRGLGVVADSLGQLGEMFEKGSTEQKLFASAQAMINTFLGATQVIADNSLPFFAKAIAVPVIIASGLAQVAKINAVNIPAKKSRGGVLDGPSHAEGGILTPYGELEGNEGVINKISMSNTSLRNMASAANVAGGGVNFGTGDGSISLSGASISAIVNGINNKQVYVSETDITSVQNKVKVIEARASY